MKGKLAELTEDELVQVTGGNQTAVTGNLTGGSQTVGTGGTGTVNTLNGGSQTVGTGGAEAIR